jgi:hypothetical protein
MQLDAVARLVLLFFLVPSMSFFCILSALEGMLYTGVTLMMVTLGVAAVLCFVLSRRMTRLGNQEREEQV